VEVAADGHFRADGLGSGEYTLHIALHEFPPGNDCGWGRLVGEYSKNVSISSGSGELNLGTLAPDPIVDPDLKVDDAAPDFAVKTLDGKILRLGDMRGKVVLVDFWAGWCAPCVAELPNMQKLEAAHQNDGKFEMIGLSLDDKLEDTQSFMKSEKLNYPQAWVGVDSDVVRAYGATAIPATFLIGPDGRIVARDLRGDELAKAVEAELAK